MSISNLLITLTVSVACIFTACTSAPDDVNTCNQTINHQLDIEKPYSDWIQVRCTTEGQIIQAAQPYRWSHKETDNVYLGITGEINSTLTDDQDKNSMKIRDSWHEKEESDFIIKNFNKFLLKENPQADTFTEVYSLGFRGNMPFTYDLFIYAKDAHPKYIIVCKEQCNIGKPILIDVHNN